MNELISQLSQNISMMSQPSAKRVLAEKLRSVPIRRRMTTPSVVEDWRKRRVSPRRVDWEVAGRAKLVRSSAAACSIVSSGRQAV